MKENPLSSYIVLNSILDNAEIGVVVHDCVGKIVDFNNWACSILGLKKEQLKDKMFFDLDLNFVKSDGSVLLKDQYPSAVTIRTGTPQCNVQLSIKTPNNERKWLSINSQITDHRGIDYTYVTFKDITNIINAQNNLNAIISSLDDVVYEVDSCGKILNIWTKNTGILNYEKSEMYNRNILDFISAQNKEIFAKAIKHTSETKTPYQTIYYPSDGPNKGKCFLVKFTVSDAVKNKLSIFVSDITSQKKAEEEIASLKDRLILAARAGGVGLWEWNLETNEIRWDDKMYELYGISKEGFIGEYLTWKRQVHPEDVDRVEKELMQSIEEVKDLNTKVRVIWPNGQERIIKIAAIVQKDRFGKATRMIGTNWDVTEEVIMENALRESEDKFRKIFRYAPTGIGLLGPKGNWLEVNDAVCEITGYSREEMLKLTFQDITHPEDLEESLIKKNKLLKGYIESYRLDKRYIHKNGSIVWVILSVSLLLNEDNTPKFIIAQMVDITPMKHLLNELETKNKILKTTALDLENKIAQLEEFSGIIAHNVRGPVASLVQLCDFLDSSDSQERQKKLLSLVKNTSSSILGTLNDLKEIVEIQMNKDFLFDSCSFEEGLTRVEQLLQVQIITRKVTLNKDLKVKEIRYPKAYLENILYNLVSNAIKYTAKNTSPQIDVSTYPGENGTTLKVTDNGVGIDLSKYGNQIFKYKKIFHEGFESTGVGLFIVKNQIETFGGNIRVESEPGKGSSFIVFFKKLKERDYLS